MRIVSSMATIDPTDALDQETPDPSDDDDVLDDDTKALADQFRVLRDRRGVSNRRISLATGIDQTHLGRFFKGSKRLSPPRMGAVLRVLNGVLLVGDLERNAGVVGTIDGTGELSHQGDDVSFPAQYEIAGMDGTFGPFRAGDRVLIQPHTEWTLGRFLVVAIGSRHRLCQAVERGGTRGLLLPEGDVVIYEAERHVIVGMATSRQPASEAV